MKALVLSGGAGTRLRPFTYSMAKQLVPVANTPVLVHVLGNIRDIGVEEVGIIVGDRAAQIRRVIGDGSKWGMPVTYLRQDEPRGLAHCVLLAADFLGDEDFVMYLGDNVFADGIEEAAATFRQRRPDAHLVVTPVVDPRHYGVAELDPDGGVHDLMEKPAHPRSNLAVTGAYFFTSAIHPAVRAIRASRRGELEITDAVRHLIDTGHKVTADRYDGYWQDTGKIDDLLECSRTLLERISPAVHGEVDEDSELLGDVLIEAGARVTGSRLVGPLVVGANSRIHSSQVGPYAAVGRDCVISDSGVRDSILLDGARLEGVEPLYHSVLGQGAEVRLTGDRRHSRLIIGDHARAELPG